MLGLHRDYRNDSSAVDESASDGRSSRRMVNNRWFVLSMDPEQIAYGKFDFFGPRQ